jgi:predicted AAA+ superfamily ATPase
LKIEEFIEEQMKERYKHFIIYGPPMQGKTKLAKYISERFNGLYINLLDEFCNDISKKENIDAFGPLKLIDYLKCLFTYNKDLIIIDQIDFLINTWDDNQLRELISFIDHDQSIFCFLFIMHNYNIFERENAINYNDKGKSRLLNIFQVELGGTYNG